MSTPLVFSVVICTHNRRDLLAEAITSLHHQTYPLECFEVIVVDNNSSDGTRELVKAQQQAGSLDVRYLFESHLGLSQARNAGACVARGDVLVYVDDDCLIDPDWLVALADVFENDEQVVCVGGRIELQWDVSRPDWLPEELEGYLGSTRHLEGTEGELPVGLHPFGGNMAIRRSALQKVGGFDPGFGRIGAHLGTNEEASLADQLRAVGRVVYTPRALVHHRVLPERAARGYFLRRGYWQGVADANLDQVRRSHSRFRLLRSVAANVFFLIGDALQVIGTRFRGQNERAFGQFVFAVARLGRLLQTARLVLAI